MFHVYKHTTRHGYKAIVQAAYDPVFAYVTGSKGERDTFRAMADKAIRDAWKERLFEQFPWLFFRVGLGATGVRFGPWDEAATERIDILAATVLEQVVIGWQNICSEGPYLGFFVGGFLDALIRQMGDETDVAYWLTGLTLGFSKRDWPVGFQAHGGLAIPFDFQRLGNDPANAWNELGWAFGATLTVPIELVYDD